VTKEIKATVKTPSKSQDSVGFAPMTKAQQKWVIDRIALLHAGEDPIVLVGDIIGRTITSLAQVTPDDRKILIPALADKVGE
jgi:hypothetical protein